MGTKKKRTVKTYTEEFKRSSAKLAVDSDQPVSATARNLGMHESTLHGWVKSYYSDDPSSNHITTDSLVEIKRLKKENARLKMERDILKKAAAYFANDLL